MKLVIKGAYYYDRDSETILIPHFTGEFSIVDCSTYEKIDSLKCKYDKNYINEVKENSINFENENYYSTEFSPYHIGDWELLSDLSQLEHLEENFDF